MKKLVALSVALLMALALCACGSEEASEPDPNEGKYLCTSILLEGMELGAGGEYLELQNGGKCSFFFYESPDRGTWERDGEEISIHIPYADTELNGTGTLQDGVIVMEIPEMGDVTMTFRLEGMEPPTEEAPAGEVPVEPATGEETAPEAPAEEAVETPS